MTVEASLKWSCQTCWPCLKDPIETLSCELLLYFDLRQSQRLVHMNHKHLPVLVLSLCYIKVMPDAMFEGPNRDPVLWDSILDSWQAIHTTMTCETPYQIHGRQL